MTCGLRVRGFLSSFLLRAWGHKVLLDTWVSDVGFRDLHLGLLNGMRRS